MNKERYLQLKKEFTIRFTLNLILGLIGIVLGILIILSGSRHIPFLIAVLAAVFLMNHVLIMPILDEKKAIEEEHPEWKSSSTKGVKIPTEEVQKRFLITAAALAVILMSFFMIYRPAPEANESVKIIQQPSISVATEDETNQ